LEEISSRLPIDRVKKLIAIFFCLLLALTQAVSIAQTPVADAGRATSSCCGCGKSCCVQKSAPVSNPAPATPARASFQNDLSLLFAASLSWTLPATDAPRFSSSSESLVVTAGLPIFQWHCALLI
jgi:hypothetical protein